MRSKRSSGSDGQHRNTYSTFLKSEGTDCSCSIGVQWLDDPFCGKKRLTGLLCVGSDKREDTSIKSLFLTVILRYCRQKKHQNHEVNTHKNTSTSYMGKHDPRKITI